MVSCIYPYGAIKESEISHLGTFNNKFYLIDKNANQWRIEENDYLKLLNKGFINKEVKNK